MKKITGAEALLEIMKHYEVEYVYGISGATEVLFMDALEKTPEIKYILGLHEVVCMGMAEGYARASGKPGILNLHTGPGLAAAMPFLADAKNAGVPLIVIVGQNDSRLLQYEPQLSGDIMGMGKSQSKWCTELYHAQDIPTVMHRAFKTALQAPAGPVVISIPQNVLEETLEFELRDKMLLYSRARPDLGAVNLASDLLKTAKNPVMIVEGGVSNSGALAETVKLAELTGSKVYQIWMTDVNFPVNHPQYCGDLDSTSPQMRNMLEEADLIVGVGCALFFDAFYKSPPIVIPNDLKIIHISDNPWELGKNFPVNCGIQADIKTALQEINEILEKTASVSFFEAAEKRIAVMKAESNRQKAELELQIEREKNNQPMSVSGLIDTLKASIDDSTITVDDSWSSSSMLRKLLAPSQAGTYLRARGGSIGFGLPGALGVKQAQPHKNVVAVCGDGSAAWSMQSFWTAAHYNIPVTFIITNNATYRQVKIVRRMILGDYPLSEKRMGLELDEPVIDFCMLAASMGVKAFKVRTRDELKAALEISFALGKPTLIEAYIEAP